MFLSEYLLIKAVFIQSKYRKKCNIVKLVEKNEINYTIQREHNVKTKYESNIVP